MDNIILQTDSYKLNHWNQYPHDTEAVYSYFESRPGAEFDYTVFFGLQAILKRYLVGMVVTQEDFEEAEWLTTNHFGSDKLFNRVGWKHIIEDHDGHLPLRIMAVPEGTKVPVNNVMMTVENTCPKCFWLTNAVESLLTHVWYPSTVATLSHNTVFNIIGKQLAKTADSMDGLPFMLHDFGYRGVSSQESAAIGGAAHLINSQGTDTLAGMLFALDHYDADISTLGFSVPATEHSVMTARGKLGEMEVVDQLIDEYPEGILSVVADSYDVLGFVEQIGTTFKQRILERDGVFVVRPDSVTDMFPDPASLVKELTYRLGNYFGTTTNSKGFRVLNPKVRILWGDGIGPKDIDKILEAAELSRYSAENYVFGMGGGLLQKINRDTQRFAFKCSAQKRDGRWHDVQKITLNKSSKAGRLRLTRDTDGELWTVNQGVPHHDHIIDDNVMVKVFEDGELFNEITFDQVRANAREGLTTEREFAVVG